LGEIRQRLQVTGIFTPKGEVEGFFRSARLGGRRFRSSRLLKALLLMALYTIRSERMSCEQLTYSLLFRWFLELDKPSFDHSSFITNRARLLGHAVAGKFFFGVVEQARTVQTIQSAISKRMTYCQPVCSTNEQTEN
jgi:hypothetical protein